MPKTRRRNLLQYPKMARALVRFPSARALLSDRDARTLLPQRPAVRKHERTPPSVPSNLPFSTTRRAGSMETLAYIRHLAGVRVEPSTGVDTTVVPNVPRRVPHRGYAVAHMVEAHSLGVPLSELHNWLEARTMEHSAEVARSAATSAADARAAAAADEPANAAWTLPPTRPERAAADADAANAVDNPPPWARDNPSSDGESSSGSMPSLVIHTLSLETRHPNPGTC